MLFRYRCGVNDLLKDNKKNQKIKLLSLKRRNEANFSATLKYIFIYFFLIYFDFEKKIKMKMNALNFVIINILNQRTTTIIDVQ